MGSLGYALYVIAILFQGLKDVVNGSKHIQIGCGSNIAFIGREAEDCNPHFLLEARLLPQIGPFECPCRNQFNSVCNGNCFARNAISSGENNRLNRSIQFRQSDLQCYLDGMQTKVGPFPIIGRLENQGQSTNIRTVELLHRLNGGLRVILGGTTDQRKAR